MLKIEYNTEFNDDQIKYLFQRLISELCLASYHESYKEDYKTLS